MSYLILPDLTTAYPVSPLSTPSYVVSYCHPRRMWLAVVGWGETGVGWQEDPVQDEVGCGRLAVGYSIGCGRR